MREWFFPPHPRYLPGQRGVNILLRAVHLVGVAGIGGGFLFGLDEALWWPCWWLTLVTGVLLSLLYLYSDGRWLLQLKGLVILFKLALLLLAFLIPGLRAELFVLIILISGLVAHAPGALRGYRWL